MKVENLQPVIDYFHAGGGVEVSDMMSSQEYLKGMQNVEGIPESIAMLGVEGEPNLVSTATEFILEGLHLHQKLNNERLGGRQTFRA